nr:cell division cycle 5-like protein [Ipomoea batatas]
MIKDEAQFLCVAMGHETESLDEFVEAHKTCLSDIMYFPTRNAYGLSSVAGNMEKLSALQSEFENVQKKMDDDTKKAQKLEQKVKVLTNGYQFRAGKIWSQIEATFKQMDTAGTELECFKVLQKQEQLAASNRINNIWEEVQKQKDLERTLQKRYGDLLGEKERIEHLMDEYKKQAQMQEIEAKNHALELATAEADAADNKMIVAPSNEDPEPIASVNDHESSTAVDPAQESPNKQTEDGSSMAVDPAQENPNEQTDNAQEQPSGSPKLGMDIDEVGSTTDTNDLSQSTPAARESSLTDEVHAENACNESESGVTSGGPQLMNADENPTSGNGGEASADASVSPIAEDQVS